MDWNRHQCSWIYFINVYDMGSGAIYVYRLVYVCGAIHDVDQTPLYAEHGDRQYFRCGDTAYWLGRACTGVTHCANCSGAYHFIWQMPHTFAIAIRKYDEYKAADVAMLPVVHGMEITKRQMAIYIACLLPLPFYLFSLGTTFVVIATVLNIGYLVLAMSGLFTNDDEKWARKMFLVSVNYLMIIFVMAIVVTLPWLG